ncbi:SHOCT domain-containing protein [Streptomyces vietnamensis]|uniref:SHOCT domain-containing protein n=1 Tax=Streptomyces vietnamensis TaxID=362257 RepID=UPI003412EFB5
MMFSYDHDVSGWGWFAMSPGVILFWALIITIAVWLFRSLDRTGCHARPATKPSPEQLLAERFARGDIDREEYRRRLTAPRFRRFPGLREEGGRHDQHHPSHHVPVPGQGEQGTRPRRGSA